MLPHNLVALWNFNRCPLLVFIVPFIFHWFLIALLDQLTGHNMKICLQWIEFSWWFTYQEDLSRLDMVSSGVFFRKQVFSSDVWHIVVFSAGGAGVDQELFSHNMTSLYPHILCYNSNILSIRGDYNPPNLLEFISYSWVSWEYGLHHLCWNVLLRNRPHRGNLFPWLVRP